MPGSSFTISVNNRGTGAFQEYEMANAPAFVVKELLLMTARWQTTDFTDVTMVQASVCQRASFLAQKYGASHP